MKTNKKNEKHIFSKFQYLICCCFTFLFLFSGNKGLLGLGEFSMNNPFRLNVAIAESFTVNKHTATVKEDIINRVIHFLTQEQETQKTQETLNNESAKSGRDVGFIEEMQQNKEELKSLPLKKSLKILMEDNKTEVRVALVMAVSETLRNIRWIADEKLIGILKNSLRKMSEDKSSKVKDAVLQNLRNLGYEVVERKILGISCGTLLKQLPPSVYYHYGGLL